jgi:hypothetical protein
VFKFQANQDGCKVRKFLPEISESSIFRTCLEYDMEINNLYIMSIRAGSAILSKTNWKCVDTWSFAWEFG